MRNLREMITHLVQVGWEAITTEVGFTGYLDRFNEVESNAYGYDKHGRAFVQVKVIVEGKEEVIRVFERYTGEHSDILVSSGTHLGARVFGSALEPNEWEAFVGLVVDGKGFTQPAKYMSPMTIHAIQ